MKKYFGYLVIIIVGIVGFLLMLERTEAIDNSVSQENNTVETFA